MSSSPLEILPSELWQWIFCLLPGRDLYHGAQLVCRSFHDIIKGSPELQYLIALFHEGMVDTGSSNLPFSDRFRLLHNRRAAWDNLNWELFPKDISPHGPRHAFGFVGGLFAALSISRNNFAVIRLPLKTSPSKQTVFAQLDIRFFDFLFDPTQDVVILLAKDTGPEERYFMHVRSLTDTKPHPGAHQPVLSMREVLDSTSAVFQLDGDLVGCLQGGATSHLEIWNWKSGQRLVEIEDDGFHHDVPHVFTFLDPNSYAVACQLGQGSGCLRIFTLASQSAPVATLLFPELVGDQKWYLSDISLEPSARICYRLSDRVFTTSPDVRVHTIRLEYKHREGPEETLDFLMLFRNDGILPFTTHSDESELIVPWDDWGPRNTRMIPIAFEEGWSSSNSYGSRVILSDYGTHKLEIMDFNYHRPPDPLAMSKGFIRRHAEPSTISRPQLFNKDVVTTLPFFRLVKELPEDFWDREMEYMIDEDRILGKMTLTQESWLYTLAL
ncbi:hypothetical protein BDN72DRAFT_847935 [Pluteus cervinus]|uniref:Uncharacterized protein n=1 Tax=Pluteus cervinus TaxID=181527 RepID=A0ACD3ACX6_9AGAR|nr:hypothetical protein BDN72DRAFT_847935 [Pluteus cervinus]